MKIVLQLYPNEEVFGFEHGDEYVYWIVINEEQMKVFAEINWLVCSVISIKISEDGIDFDISEGDVGQALQVLDKILVKLTEEVLT